MNTVLNSALTLTYNQLSTFAGLDNFWNLFDTAFGTQYNRSGAEILRLQWLSGDFSQVPQIEILDSSILGGANGAYASSNNKIYLSANFLATSTAEAISAVLLEEIGHFIDAQINQIDTPGDEGEKFSALVRGQNLTTQELDRINTENDWANITVDGKVIAVEQAAPIVLTVTTTADQNDGSATGGLSLRDAIIIANANPTTDYKIQLTGGTTYNLTSNGINENAALTGDLDIKSRSNVLYIVAVGGQATINASGLLNSDRVFQVLDGGQLSLQNVMVTGGNISSDGGGIRVDSNAALDLYNSTVTGNKASGFFNRGGGIYNSGFVYLRNGSIVSNNIAAGDSSQEGGGIYNSGGTLIATNSTISNNEGGVYGGGISTVSGSVTLINTTVRGNSAGNGGGIRSNGTSVTLLNTTISGNSANSRGGGIYASTNGVFNLINSTVTKNTAISTEYGNGGGGIYSLSATVNLKNTIVAGNINSNAPDLLSSFLSSALFNGNNNNLIGNLTGAKGTVGTGTDIVNPNPGLGPLQNNGGLTLTHALLSGSPAINAGNNSLIPADTEDLDGDGNRTEPIPYDQRGLMRLVGGGVDIGAFEVQAAALPSLSIKDITVTEGNTGTTNATFTVTLSGETFQPVTVNYATANGTATAGSDYTATTGTLIFNVNPGETSKQITVSVLGDSLFEGNETFFVNLSNAINANIADAQGQGTINNDDVALPTITLAVSPTSVSEDGTTNLIYIFTRTGATTNTLTVNYGITGTANTSDYTGATPGTGKTITFAAGASTATLTIDPTADTIVESNETVALTLATGTGYTIGTTTAVIGTITNDDLLPNLNLSANKTIVEGNTNPQNVTYTVTLSSTSTQTITVQYATANGTAIAGSDYTSTSGTLTFNPGVTSQVINIPILNDSINEANETFSLTLNSPTNASLGTSQTVTTTISDTLSAAATTTLPTNVENLTLTGTAAINGTGNAGNNVITGNSANNTLSGLNGNDTYSFVANSALGTDTITETATGGTDTIDFTGTTAALNVNLGVTTSRTVNSNLKLILSANNVIENATGGTGNDRLTGNALNNTLNGGSGNDQLQGLGGNDTLWGGAGNDILNGGTGNDSLWGGLGDDILMGGVGNDQYLFQSSSVFSTSLGVDYISEFEAGLDQIVLSKATFNAITDLQGQALTDFAVVSDDEFVNASNARIVFSQGTGSLFYNQDGNVLGTGTVFEFARLGNPDITLSSSNFSLIA
jgi:Ca2+-binding RTX toxin-like protein